MNKDNFEIANGYLYVRATESEGDWVKGEVVDKHQGLVDIFKGDVIIFSGSNAELMEDVPPVKAGWAGTRYYYVHHRKVVLWKSGKEENEPKSHEE